MIIVSSTAVRGALTAHVQDLPDLENAHIYLLDGLDLGRRGDLMVKSNRYKKWNDDENSPRHSAL